MIGDWTGFFRALAGWKQEAVSRLNVGSDAILLILAIETANWEMEEVVIVTVFACPIPSVSLFPLVTLFPC